MVAQTFTVNLTSAVAPTTQSLTMVMADGTQHVFSAAQGEQLDDYIDPLGQFRMHCILCHADTLPDAWAFYRPDEGSGREEWVVEFGSPWSTNVRDLGAYTANIVKLDGTTVSISVPYHWWFSRWRWQSAPRPVRAKGIDLMRAGLIPFLNATGLCLGGIKSVPAYTPMAMCGIPMDQGQTGIYPGIGLLTGWQAQYFTRKETPAGEYLFRNQAEAVNSMQQHVRDWNKRRAIDIITDYPQATMYSPSNGSPYFTYTKHTRTDQGHNPSCTYIPFLLTGDPYYLEAHQFQTNQVPLQGPGNSNRWSLNGRYFAWPLRNVAQAVLITPATVPNWLLPKSYFQAMLDQNKSRVMAAVNDTSDPWRYVFHTIPDTGQSTSADPGNSGDHVWQQNYVAYVTSWMVAAGFISWKQVAEWNIRSQIDRASPTSGYMRAYPSPYHIRMRNASVLASAMLTTDLTIKLQYPDTFKQGEVIEIPLGGEKMTLGAYVDGLVWPVIRATPRPHALADPVYGHKFTSWPELIASNKLTNPTKWTFTGNDTFAQPVADLTYPSNHRAALMQAVNAGLVVSGLTEAAAWMDTEVRKYTTSSLQVDDGWAVVAPY